MNRIGWVLLILAMSTATWSARAAEVEGLYEARVPVADRGAEKRGQALRAALERVLVKVSGFGAIGEEPAVSSMLENADRYVQRFRYESEEVEDEREARQLLWVQFDRGAVNKSMREKKLPVWGDTRPAILAWVAVEDGQGRELVGATDAGEAAGALKSAAERRALPLRLPLLDLQDQAAVRVADVWGGFREPVLEASQRYDAQAVLIGRMYRERGVWHGSWVLHQGSDSMRWETEASEMVDSVAQGLGGAADHLSVRFAQVFGSGGKREMDVTVAGVKDLGGYARVMNYLRSVDGVTGVLVSRVENRRILCHLVLETDAEKVAQTIALGSVLDPEEGTAIADGEALSEVVRYRLLR